MYERLRISPDTLEMLRNRGVTVHVHPTDDAVRQYNTLAETDAVAGLFHSTC